MVNGLSGHCCHHEPAVTKLDVVVVIVVLALDSILEKVSNRFSGGVKVMYSPFWLEKSKYTWVDASQRLQQLRRRGHSYPKME